MEKSKHGRVAGGDDAGMCAGVYVYVCESACAYVRTNVRACVRTCMGTMYPVTGLTRLEMQIIPWASLQPSE